MRLRVKFSKHNEMRYISHLDVMRFFQKILRRAEADVQFSEGFHPHILLSFALPLGVGMTSDGEYFDVEVNSCPDTKALMDKMNACVCDGFRVLSVNAVPDDKWNKCMTLTAAAAYDISAEDFFEICDTPVEKIKDFLSQNEINVLKKTKRNETITDIKPGIYELIPNAETKTLHMTLSAGSIWHIKPELVLKALIEFAGGEYAEKDRSLCRCELYAKKESGLVPLENCTK